MRPMPLQIIALVLLVLGLSLSLGCQNHRNVDDSAYKSRSVKRYDDGGFRKGKLDAPTVVDGMLCDRWVHRHADGVLRGVQLAEDTEVAGFALPEGTFLWFDADGRLETAWLSRDTQLAGHACKGGGGKVATSFYPDGTLRAFVLRVDRDVDGFPCRASLFHPIKLHSNGDLASCQLARATAVGGVSFDAGSVIEIDTKGSATLL